MAEDGTPPRVGSASADLAYGTLNDSLGFLLRLAQLQVFDGFYADLAETGVRPGELTVLLMLAENPGVRQGVLARALRIKRAHMTKLVQRLEGQGLVSRAVPSHDRRSVVLRLTAKGEARVEALRAPLAAHEARQPGRLTPAEAAELKALLHRFLGLAESG